MAAPVFVPNHPLISHNLGLLRHQGTSPMVFRGLVREIAQFLFYEAMRDMQLRPIDVTTPLMTTTGYQISDKIGLIPVLRAGLGMADALLEAWPTASVWHLGLYRDHQTLKPVTYYNKMPAKHGLDVAIVLDPMLATGGSASEAINILKRAGVPKVKFVGLIASPEGVNFLQTAHPEVPAYIAAIDSHLNEQGYIVPGLGDAGDRQFGTGG